MAKVKCGLIQMALKGDGTMQPVLFGSVMLLGIAALASVAVAQRRRRERC